MCFNRYWDGEDIDNRFIIWKNKVERHPAFSGTTRGRWGWVTIADWQSWTPNLFHKTLKIETSVHTTSTLAAHFESTILSFDRSTCNLEQHFLKSGVSMIYAEKPHLVAIFIVEIRPKGYCRQALGAFESELLCTLWSEGENSRDVPASVWYWGQNEP